MPSGKWTAEALDALKADVEKLKQEVFGELGSDQGRAVIEEIAGAGAGVAKDVVDNAVPAIVLPVADDVMGALEGRLMSFLDGALKKLAAQQSSPAPTSTPSTGQ